MVRFGFALPANKSPSLTISNARAVPLATSPIFSAIPRSNRIGDSTTLRPSFISVWLRLSGAVSGNWSCVPSKTSNGLRLSGNTSIAENGFCHASRLAFFADKIAGDFIVSNWSNGFSITHINYQALPTPHQPHIFHQTFGAWKDFVSNIELLLVEF